MELHKGKLYFSNNGGEYKELGRIENAEINQEYKTCSSITGERWTVPLSQTFQGTDVKEAVYQANQEAINSTKLKLRILENQLNREYNNTGRSNI